MQDLAAFKTSPTGEQLGMTEHGRQALWWIGKGDCNASHAIAAPHNDEPDRDVVHAYRHRMEGDGPNTPDCCVAARATPPTLTLDEEREAIARRVLAVPPKGAGA